MSILYVVGAVAVLPRVDAFAILPGTPVILTALPAKNSSSKPKGFGKVDTTTKPAIVNKVTSATSDVDNEKKIKSLEFKNIPVVETTKLTQNDEGSTPEERAKALLRNKYGMKTLEEQKMDAKQFEAYQEQQKKLAEWKKMAVKGKDFDIMSIIPAPILIAIDRFLKLGTAVCTISFVLAGGFITIEAWSKVSDSPLPDNLDNFIVNTVEPAFTPGLFVLLGFSVSLGAFAALQLGSQGSTYKEE